MNVFGKKLRDLQGARVMVEKKFESTYLQFEI